MAIIIRRLQQDDLVDGFDCQDEPLNNYLKKHAWTNQEKSSIGVTYVATDESAPHAVIGYFTLGTSSVAREAMPREAVRGLPGYDLPTILLARLAVDHRFRGRRLGEALLAEALRIAVSVSGQAGCRCVVVDAYPSAVAFYRRYGFIPIEGSKGNSQRMYLDIRTLRSALSSDRPE